MTNLNIINLMSWTMLIMIMSLIMTNSIHPVLIILMILIFNSTLCINMSMWKMHYLYSLMYFLIMISGLLIIFLYFSSLISNETSWTNLNSSLPIILTSMLIYIINNYPHYSILLSINLSSSIQPNQSLMTNFKNFWWQSFKLMYSPPSSNMTFICMIYLLIVMISIIKICSHEIKSMRKLN